MWSGWLAITALWALITVGLVAEQVTCNWCWSWAGTFIITFIFLGVLLVFSVWPCVRYQRGFTSKESVAMYETTDDPSKARARIDEDRKRLYGDRPAVLFSVVESVLLLATAITLAVELDAQRANNAPSVDAPVALAITALAVAALAFVGNALREAFTRPRHYENMGVSTNPAFSTLFVCCHTPAEDVDPTKRERAPACFGDFPLNSWATSLYNVVLVVATILVIVALALSISFFNNGRPANELADVLWPVWTAIGLFVVASFILLGAAFYEGSAPCYDAFMVGFSIVVLAGMLWTSIWLLQAATLPPHVIATPLYVVLSLAVVVFTVLQVWRCQSSYRIVDTHQDHGVLVQDGIVLGNAVATSQFLYAESSATPTSPAVPATTARSGQVQVRFPDE